MINIMSIVYVYLHVQHAPTTGGEYFQRLLSHWAAAPESHDPQYIILTLRYVKTLLPSINTICLLTSLTSVHPKPDGL